MEERRRRVALAQGLAALACFIAVHGAHGATPAYTISGTPGPDYLIGTGHADVLCGRAGNDALLDHGWYDGTLDRVRSVERRG
jgi:hypothetical protein